MTYKEASAQACEGCREDWFIIGRTHWGKDDETLTCTAPKRDNYEHGLLARIAELEADQRRLDFIIDQSNHAEHTWLDESVWDDLPGDSEDVLLEVRASIDAAMKATK